MDPYTLLYLFYSAKLGFQASIYPIWLRDHSSGTIAFIALVVAAFSAVPFIHSIVHIFLAKPLSNPAFIAYLSFSLVFAIFQCESTKGGEQRVLQFAVVISFDSVSLLIFLLQRQIRRLHNILTLDIEQGHIGAEGIGDISATAVDRGHGQHEQRDSSARPEMRQVMPEYGYDGNQVGRLSIRSIGAETPRLDRVAGQPGGLATDGGRSGLGADGGEPSRRFAEIPRYNGWGGRMAHSMPAGQEQGRVDQQPGRPDRRSAYSIPVGIDPGFGGIQSPCISPATIIDNSQHPALRSAHDTSQPMPRDGFHTPPEVPSPLETDAPGQLHF